MHAIQGDSDVRHDDEDDWLQRAHVQERSTQQSHWSQRWRQHGLAFPLPTTNAVRTTYVL